jgi:hypothetical protein
MMGGWWKFWGMSVEVEVEAGGRGKDERARDGGLRLQVPESTAGSRTEDNHESGRGPMDIKEFELLYQGDDGDGSNGERQ